MNISQNEQKEDDKIEKKFKRHKKIVNKFKEDNIQLASLISTQEDRMDLESKKFKDL